jgi:hypothetical protein
MNPQLSHPAPTNIMHTTHDETIPNELVNAAPFRMDARFLVKIIIVVGIVVLHFATGMWELVARALNALLPTTHDSMTALLRTMNQWAVTLMLAAFLTNSSTSASRKFMALLERHRVGHWAVWPLRSVYLLLLAFILVGIWMLKTDAPPSVALLGSLLGLHGILLCLNNSDREQGA